MAENSTIEWTHHTFNPWVGCVKVSPGCDHCYAESNAKRQKVVWGKDAARRFASADYWLDPERWNRAAEKLGERRRVFCASMCDVMERRPELDAPRQRLFNLIEATPYLDWLLLTKRPQEYEHFLPKTWLETPRPNVWLMTTVESPEFSWRADTLKSVPAAIRGLSIEPLLEPMPTLHEHLAGIDWVIVGGESQYGARPMQPDWARSIRDQCVAAGVAFFFKQWGEHDADLVRIGKKMAGRLLDGREWSEYPMKTHPACDLFPALDRAEFDALAEDIRRNGLLEPIWTDGDGLILDGRNRYRACIKAGVEPKYRTWKGDASIVEFVISCNVHRRHLTASQKAMIAADTLPLLEAEAKQRQRDHGGTAPGKKSLKENIPQVKRESQSRDIAAKAAGVNPRYVSDAKRLKEQRPDLGAEVRSGAKTLPEAKRIVTPSRKKARYRSRKTRATDDRLRRDILRLLRAHDPSISKIEIVRKDRRIAAVKVVRAG